MRSLARNGNASSTSVAASPQPHEAVEAAEGPIDDDGFPVVDEVQEQAATARNDDPSAAQPVSREDEAFEDLERGVAERDR